MFFEKEEKKVELAVLTPTGKAASEAIKASGIKSKTIDSFLLSLEKEAKEQEKSLLVQVSQYFPYIFKTSLMLSKVF